MAFQGTYGSDQLQPSMYGSLSVVLVRLGIAEVDQDPITHVLRYEATEVLHGLCNTRSGKRK